MDDYMRLLIREAGKAARKPSIIRHAYQKIREGDRITYKAGGATRSAVVTVKGPMLAVRDEDGLPRYIMARDVTSIRGRWRCDGGPRDGAIGDDRAPSTAKKR